MFSFAPAMKGIAAVILMLLFSVQTFSKWMWVLDYQLNKEYIAENLCINKAKPQLHCNGKCQLAKKLAEEESSHKPSGADAPKQNLFNPFFKQDLQLVVLSWSEPRREWNTFHTIKPYTAPVAAVFHPPSV